METKNNGRALHRGTVEFVNGPVIKAAGMRNFGMREVVHVGPKKLMGEIIKMDGSNATIQVYEDTDGLKIYEDVVGTGEPLSIELGPGLIGSFFDGIGRPLDALLEHEGMYISPGTTVNMINRDKIWDITPVAKVGDMVAGGMVLATIQETPLLVHKIMVPPNLEGEVTWITPSGKHSAGSDAARIKDAFGREITIPIIQRWPVRTPRPYRERLLPNEPFVTGQRVIDGLFPLAKGGTACIPGGFGTGKTVTQHQLAKWGDAQVVIYIGCGERGNEMTDVLLEFPELEDPRSGQPLMKRTLLIANTSNMPVAAREASIYTGITIAEYFRDMGYSVALMADSTSRWAEALREMSGRLEEMPGEEGYPAYLGTRLASFYERAGRAICFGKDGREGAVSVIGAVSPPGGDLSEPVTQNTLRVTKVFWGLDSQLAFQRHFPAINWLNSYSLYAQKLGEYWDGFYDGEWSVYRTEAMSLLEDEDKLKEIVRLVGVDALSKEERMVLETSKSIREDFLHQNSFHEIDTYASMDKQFKMLRNILTFHSLGMQVLKRGGTMRSVFELPIREEISRMRYTEENDLAKLDELETRIKSELGKLLAMGGEHDEVA